MNSTEHTNNHDTEPCQVSTRAVEIIVEELDTFLAGLPHFAPSVFAVALLTTAHRLASDDGTAVDLHDRHQRMLCETGEMFECRKCGTIKLALAVADDEDPGTCDVCFEESRS